MRHSDHNYYCNGPARNFVFCLGSRLWRCDAWCGLVFVFTHHKLRVEKASDIFASDTQTSICGFKGLLDGHEPSAHVVCSIDLHVVADELGYIWIASGDTWQYGSSENCTLSLLLKSCLWIFSNLPCIAQAALYQRYRHERNDALLEGDDIHTPAVFQLYLRPLELSDYLCIRSSLTVGASAGSEIGATLLCEPEDQLALIWNSLPSRSFE